MTAVAMGTRLTPAFGDASKGLGGIPRLLEDLQRLADDHDSADIVFLIGREEAPVYAHKLILMARCKSFQNVTRGEICKIPGASVTPSVPGSPTPTPIRLAHCQAEVFREVLQYVYTAKMVLQESTVFEVLVTAQELGVEELRAACEEHIGHALATQNACAFLVAAMAAQDRAPGSKENQSFVERCTTFIGDNASDCVKTSGFLSLTKEALIQVVASDNLILDEEDVWRSVLSWAKHQGGVTQPAAHWTEEERARVCLHLSGVIGHVRLLLIDSHVFAEEVEPTGAVPMELSLERYRFAALPSKFNHPQDKRLQPRHTLKMFPSSKILDGDKVHYQKVLNSWCGNPKKTWRLIYRASTHGYSAEAFHCHCDGIEPTVILVMGTHGEICGGYSDAPWGKASSKQRYSMSEEAFLFTLINDRELPPTKFPIIKKLYAIAHHPEFGPIFGAGADLCIANNCNLNMDSYSNLPHTYGGDGASSTILMGSYNFGVLDYEVFCAHGAK